MRVTKRMYKAWARNDRGVLWWYHESNRSRQRVALAALGFLEGTGSHLQAHLEMFAQRGTSALEFPGSYTVVVSRHAMEALFRKAQRLDRGTVYLEVRQAVTSIFQELLFVRAGEGYQEWEIRTEHGVALAIVDPEQGTITITTWVPNSQLRPD